MWLFFWYSFGNCTGNFRKMYKMQIFQETLSAVMDETGLERRQILSNGKEEESVDARAVLIKILNERGLYPIQISRFTGICQRSVNRFLIGFKERCDARKIMRLNYENVKTTVGLT